MKRCSKCGECKPLDDFRRDARRKDGRHSYCKECNRAHFARWAAAHPERRRTADARWLAANRERKREYNARYRAANRERRREYDVHYQRHHRAEQWAQAIAIFKAAEAWCGHEADRYEIDHIHGDGEIERRSRSNSGRGFTGVNIARDVVQHPERAGCDLQLLCVPCHREKTRRERERLRLVDELAEAS